MLLLLLVSVAFAVYIPIQEFSLAIDNTSVISSKTNATGSLMVFDKPLYEFELYNLVPEKFEREAVAQSLTEFWEHNNLGRFEIKGKFSIMAYSISKPSKPIIEVS